MNFEDYLRNLIETLERFRQHGLKSKHQKCLLFQKELELVGRNISSNQFKMTSKDSEEWSVPISLKKLERYLGLSNYHCVLVKKCRTGKNALQFNWSE